MKLVLLGDTHGNTACTLNLLEYTHEHADAFVQLGDFGFWPRHPDGLKFLRRVNTFLETHDKYLFWIDGNHEDFDMLEKLMVNSTPEGFLFDERWPRVLYIPRGHTWVWDDVVFGALGGAVSVDHKFRTLGKNLFTQETPTSEEFNRLAGKNLDVLLSHDAPVDVLLQSQLRVDHVTEHRSRQVRIHLQAIVNETTPTHVFHGHWHQRKISTLKLPTGKICEVHSLQHDGVSPKTQRNWVVFDTNCKKVVPVTEGNAPIVELT